MVVAGFTMDCPVLTLGRKIAAVHVMYRKNRECIHWFGQLTFHIPEILPSLIQDVQHKEGKDGCMVSIMYMITLECISSLPDSPSVCGRESAG